MRHGQQMSRKHVISLFAEIISSHPVASTVCNQQNSCFLLYSMCSRCWCEWRRESCILYHTKFSWLHSSCLSLMQGKWFATNQNNCFQIRIDFVFSSSLLLRVLTLTRLDHQILFWGRRARVRQPFSSSGHLLPVKCDRKVIHAAVSAWFYLLLPMWVLENHHEPIVGWCGSAHLIKRWCCGQPQNKWRFIYLSTFRFRFIYYVVNPEGFPKARWVHITNKGIVKARYQAEKSLTFFTSVVNKMASLISKHKCFLRIAILDFRRMSNRWSGAFDLWIRLKWWA